MTELINYGLSEEDKDFIVRCLRQMGNHFHNIERDMRTSANPSDTNKHMAEKLNKDATTCVVIADRLEAGQQLVVTNYPPEAVEHDTTM